MFKNFKYYILFIYFVLSTNVLFAKSVGANEGTTVFFEKKHEVGINASQLLSNLLSLNTTTASTTPFGIHYAHHFGKYTFRIGANAFYKTQKDFSGPNPTDKNLVDHTFGGRVCLERHIAVLPKLNLHACLDAIVKNEHSESKITNQFFTSSNTLSIGGGPALRLIFKLNSHVNFMTEATMYGLYGSKENRVQINTPLPDIKTGTESSFILSPPTSFFIQILF